MISFSTVEIKYDLKSKIKVRNWIKSIIVLEGKVAGDIAYVFCNDEYLLKVNQKFLGHDTLTDIITFDYSKKEIMSADICISIERVIENSIEYKTTMTMELGRVMAHGVLHLLGYKDKTPADKNIMRGKEDFYLESFPI